MYVCMYVCMYVFMYVCKQVCIYLCICRIQDIYTKGSFPYASFIYAFIIRAKNICVNNNCIQLNVCFDAVRQTWESIKIFTIDIAVYDGYLRDESLFMIPTVYDTLVIRNSQRNYGFKTNKIKLLDIQAG